MSHADLLSRLQSATSPSRELDAEGGQQTMTARDVIAEALAKFFGRPNAEFFHADADVAVGALLSAPDSVRQELAALLNPWRPVETAPKDGTIILTELPWLPYAKPLFWAAYANEWRCPASEKRAAGEPYDPTHWLPLPRRTRHER